MYGVWGKCEFSKNPCIFALNLGSPKGGTSVDTLSY